MKRILAALCWTSLLFWCEAGSACETECPWSSIAISGADEIDIEDGCQAVILTQHFLESAGLSMPHRVTIHLVDSPDTSPLGSNEMGRYNAHSVAIHVLGFQAAVSATSTGGHGLEKVTTRDHWRSYIVHELTHAAIHEGCDSTCPARAIHEYIAGVAQISALPPEERANMLASYGDLAPFEKSVEISEIYYAINPHFFAIKSYKHYQRLPDPKSFIKNALQLTD